MTENPRFHCVLLFIHIQFSADENRPFFRLAVYPASSITDLTAVDASLKAMELQVQAIKDRLRDEIEAIPKAKVVFRSISGIRPCLLDQKMQEKKDEL